MPTADELLDSAAVATLAACLNSTEPDRDWSAVEASAAEFELSHPPG